MLGCRAANSFRVSSNGLRLRIAIAIAYCMRQPGNATRRVYTRVDCMYVRVYVAFIYTSIHTRPWFKILRKYVVHDGLSSTKFPGSKIKYTQVHTAFSNPTVATNICPQKTSEVIRINHPHLSIASLYMYLGQRTFILRLVFLKLVKIDFGPMWSAKNDSFQRLL